MRYRYMKLYVSALLLLVTVMASAENITDGVDDAMLHTDTLVTESICLAEEYQLLAKKLDITFVDTRQWQIDLSFDGVHFTESGHHTFAKCLIAYI